MNRFKICWNKKDQWYLGVALFFIVMQIGISLGFIKLPNDVIFVNRSGSLPTGYYIAVPMGELKKGDIVRVEVPKDMEVYIFGRGWMHEGESLLKKVGGLEGDSYHVDDRFFEINGQYIGPIYDKDSKNLPMPNSLRGDFVVKEGYFLPIADRIPNSFDARYFGDVPISSIKGKVIPLFVDK